MITTAEQYHQVQEELRQLEERLHRLQQSYPLGAKGFTKAGIRKMIMGSMLAPVLNASIAVRYWRRYQTNIAPIPSSPTMSEKRYVLAIRRTISGEPDVAISSAAA